MKLRQTLLSKSAITYVYDNYCRDYADAYLFSRQLASQFKHPILLDYRENITNTRLALGYSDRKFRTLLNNAIRFKLAQVEGRHLRFLSNAKDKSYFKQSKKNDYRRTFKPQRFVYLVLIQSLYYSQLASIKSKQDQPELIIQNSDFANRLSGYNKNVKNYSITASCRAVSKRLKLNSTSKAKSILDDLNASGLIVLTKQERSINREEAFDLMRNGFRHAVRMNTNTLEYSEIFASTLKLNYTLKRTKPSQWDLMSDHERMIAEEMGYTKDYYSI